MANPIEKGILLSSIRPELLEEWDFEKNDKLGLDFHVVTKGLGKKAHWICKKDKNHKWEALICDRGGSRKKGCPYCSGRRTLNGYNDMWTTNPELASLLENSEDGYVYSQSSNIKLDWKCKDCNSIIKNKSPNSINQHGLSCKKCGDGMSYPEKFMYSLLKSLNLEFTYDSIFEWSNRKQYDFYLPSCSLIIEMHGIQHYEQSARGRSLQEEQENDRYKEQLAKDNGIEHYIVIDCRKSEFDFIKQNILNSKLKDIININEKSFESFEIIDKSIVVESWELWNTGLFRITELAEYLKIGTTTIRMYLKKGKSIGKCNYEESKRYEKMSKKIIKLDLKNNPIQIYKSIRNASVLCNYPTHSTIRVRCANKGGVYDNYKWMYLEDYLKVNNILNENDIRMVS